MNEFPLHYYEISPLIRALRRGEVDAFDLCGLILERIDRLDGHVNSFLSVRPAPPGPKDLSGGQERFPEGPLAGVPLSIKDLIATRDLPTTAGSRVALAEESLKGDAELVRRLLRAGAVIVGKNSLHEFAFGVTNVNEHFGPCRNPWDGSRISGGSSGGSATAVAAGLSFGSVGTDTRGSIRIPSACCGVSGLKPTWGAVPMSGIVPLSTTLDHAGPIARTVADLTLLFEALTGSRMSKGEDRSQGASIRIGLCPYYYRNLDREVEAAIVVARRVLEEEGIDFVAVEMPFLDEALEASDLISRWEAYHFHRPYLETQGSAYGPKVRGRLESGRSVTKAEYREAQRIRGEVKKGFARVFEEVDCLLGATLPVTAPSIGAETVLSGSVKESIITAFVRLNAPQNMAGIPALALLCGFDSKGLPISMQLIGGEDSEAFLLELGRLYQSRTEWHSRRPALG